MSTEPTLGESIEKSASSTTGILSTLADLAISFTGPIGMAANVISSLATGDTIGTHLTGTSSIQDTVGDYAMDVLKGQDESKALARAEVQEEDIAEKTYSEQRSQPIELNVAELARADLQGEILSSQVTTLEQAVVAENSEASSAPTATIGINADSREADLMTEGANFGYGNDTSLFDTASVDFGYPAETADIGSSFDVTGTDFGYNDYDFGDSSGGDMSV